MTIQEGILFGLEECARRIGNPQQNNVFYNGEWNELYEFLLISRSEQFFGDVGCAARRWCRDARWGDLLFHGVNSIIYRVSNVYVSYMYRIYTVVDSGLVGKWWQVCVGGVVNY